MKKIITTLCLAIVGGICFAQSISVSFKGDLDPNKWKKGQEVSVTFNRFPTTVEEFKQVQAQLGEKPQGAVVLQLMAFEMWHKDAKAGKECVELANISNNWYSVESRVKEVYGGDASYGRPHLVATFLKGAKPENGFKPEQPYTVIIRSSINKEIERSEMLKGFVLHLDVYSDGYDTHWRGVDVIKQKGSQYYQVSNSPSMYVQCKDVPFDAPDYEGLK